MYLPFWKKSGFSIEHLAKDSDVLSELISAKIWSNLTIKILKTQRSANIKFCDIERVHKKV